MEQLFDLLARAGFQRQPSDVEDDSRPFFDTVFVKPGAGGTASAPHATA